MSCQAMPLHNAMPCFQVMSCNAMPCHHILSCNYSYLITQQVICVLSLVKTHHVVHVQSVQYHIISHNLKIQYDGVFTRAILLLNHSTWRCLSVDQLLLVFRTSHLFALANVTWNLSHWLAKAHNFQIWEKTKSTDHLVNFSLAEISFIFSCYFYTVPTPVFQSFRRNSGIIVGKVTKIIFWDTSFNITCKPFYWFHAIKIILCSSIKYPYLSHGRETTPMKFQSSFTHFFNLNDLFCCLFLRTLHP